ncbi:uncharacterized protein LY89DRAFT_729122 [Mollisia scopiformis]|uniref:Uncharacterized protein n=1 Tax=Mollisia scopiformis TaxID=149040 RepID=A0A194XPE4_MOLSC|nr:uncharacterized protein LY89DRAFT_729122 [Mollisia scopiformis]KUJ21607.1 hypothetical protein LY89DRAFT_729122 [Mollisia scopiformis]
MQLLQSLLALATLLLPLVSAEACVAGGPSEQVSFAKGCCFNNAGTWYQFYDVQAICIFPDDRATSYKHCVGYIPYSQLDTVCIPGDGGVGLPSGSATLTATGTGRVTFTAGAAVSTFTS